MFVLRSDGVAQEIAEGVDDMQVSYGIDTDGNFSARILTLPPMRSTP
ncbi:MAG: PilW family protein [Uliginosibacterium sp.]|nr:PilW family protein [Uliginosibacterium sp.]